MQRLTLLKGTIDELLSTEAVLYDGEICLISSNGKGYDSLVIGDGITKAKNLSLISLNISKGAVFLGIANKETNPGKPNQSVFYITNEHGKFPGFGDITIEEGNISLLKWNSQEWEVIELMKVDSELDEESYNPVQNKIITKKLKDLEKEIIKVITINGVEVKRIGNSIDLKVDEILSESSVNPIMNKTVTAKINEFNWYEGE